MIIAIDGLAGTGKSSAAKLLSEQLKGFELLDTGATYRCVALHFIKNEIEISDENDYERILDEVDIKFEFDENPQKVILNGVHVTERIRERDVSNMSGKVAQIPEVRKFLHKLQREIGSNGNFVVEGRDIGTIVFPDASFKFFVTARPEVKAERRHNQNLERGIESSYEQVLKDILERDARDEKNTIKASDAILIETDDLSLEEVVEKMKKEIPNET